MVRYLEIDINIYMQKEGDNMLKSEEKKKCVIFLGGGDTKEKAPVYLQCSGAYRKI